MRSVNSVTAGALRFEHLDRPLGMGTATPRLSWQISTDDPAWAQTAYELELDGERTARVASADQVLVPWPFAPLASRACATLRVRAASGDRWSAWSDPATAEVGLLEAGDWRARFITPRELGHPGEPAPMVSGTVTLREGIASARLYATAHGVYEATINGRRVGDQVLAPGWTDYRHRLRYQTYDVADLLVEGDNVIDALLGDGWYRGRLGWPGSMYRPYGQRLALLAQLEVTYADGTTDVFGTDRTWSARESGVLANSLYDGQRTDLRVGEGRVGSVDVLDDDLGRLVAPEGPPVRVTQVVPAASVWTTPSGTTMVDFEQNVAGWVRLRVRKGHAGQEVAVRHAEALDGGALCVRTLRSAKATDTYVLGDAAETVLEPSFTYHGFRYAEIVGAPDVRPSDVEAVVLGSDLRRIGWFACSDPDLERLHENVVWSARANLFDVPTDCPQRDERLGWTGDLQLFSPTASFLFDTAGFLSSWLADLAAAQDADGSVPWIVPEIPEAALDDPHEITPDLLHVLGRDQAGWGDAATVVPWMLFQRYGDAGLLARQFASMSRWVDRLWSLTRSDVRAGGFQFGDWLDPTAPPQDPSATRADPDVVATAYLARSAQIVADAARVLGRVDDADRYAALAARTRDAFGREYVTDRGRVLSDAPTVYAMAIEWDLLASAQQRRYAGRRLADLVRARAFRAPSGILGTALLTDALAATGHVDVAYRLLLERGCPSWLYQVAMGATTMWERWDAVRPDGSVNPGEMTSFNHYVLGTVADWLHRRVAGLAPGAAGYREIVVAPLPTAHLTHASARHRTPYGVASAAWRRHDGALTVEIEVPVGARAVVRLAGRDEIAVGHGAHVWTIPDPCAGHRRPIVTIRDALDAPELWEAVTELAARELGLDAGEIGGRCGPFLDAPVDQLPLVAVLHHRDGRVPEVRRALSRVVAERCASSPVSA